MPYWLFVGAEWNSTTYNILLTGMSCIVGTDKNWQEMTELYYKDPDSTKYSETDASVL